MVAIEILFWIGIIVLFYCYIGYPLLLRVILLFKSKKNITKSTELVPVTVIVPVYNEEKILEAKIKNCLSIDYPAEKINFLFINDGSNDTSKSIINKYSIITLVNKEKRQGKSAALNDALKQVTTPLVIFSDANNMMQPDSIKKLVSNFTSPHVGGVSGEKKIISAETTVSMAEKVYWNYESFLKKNESLVYSIVGADGGLYAIRTELFQPLDESIILDDFFISMKICEKGYLFLYEPLAIGFESASVSVEEEQKRKTRISVGCFQALSKFSYLLDPIKNFRLFLIYISHRVLRWAVGPFLLPFIFLLNILIALSNETSLIYLTLLIGQTGFYICAIVGWLLIGAGIQTKIFSIPFYFLFMNFSFYRGLLRYTSGKQSVMWEKSNRTT